MFDFGQILVNEQENKELWFRAEMTHRQFASLLNKLVNAAIEDEVINLDFFVNKLERAKNLNLEKVN